MAYNYVGKSTKDHARAVANDAPISQKQAIEICNFIRGRKVAQAKMLLEKVIKQEIAVPMKRYNRGGTGHKPGIGPGRYPEKASRVFIELLNSVEANAKFKGLNTANLKITHICAQSGSKRVRYGRKRAVEMKRAHVEIIVEEVADKKPAKKAVSKKDAKPAEKKAAPKKEEPKKEVKPTEEKPTPNKTKEEKKAEPNKETPKKEDKPKEEKPAPKEDKNEAPKETPKKEDKPKEEKEEKPAPKEEKPKEPVQEESK